MEERKSVGEALGLRLWVPLLALLRLVLLSPVVVQDVDVFLDEEAVAGFLVLGNDEALAAPGVDDL